MPRPAMTLSVALMLLVSHREHRRQLRRRRRQTHPRARDLGVPFDGTPGPLNAITDVDGRRGRAIPR